VCASALWTFEYLRSGFELEISVVSESAACALLAFGPVLTGAGFWGLGVGVGGWRIAPIAMEKHRDSN